MLALGKYPEVSLSDARDRRLAARKLLASGIDPSDKKKSDKRVAALDAQNSFRAVAKDWHDTNKSKWTPEHATRLWRRLELYVFPDLGGRPIASIKTPDLIPVLRKHEKAGILDTAGRVAQVMNVVFRYAVHSGIIQQNPANDLRGILAPHTATHFAAIHPSELPQFLSQLEGVAASTQNRIAVRLLLHTFLRPSELRYGKWDEIDLQTKLWEIPANRMKKRKPHVVPLSKQSLALLSELKALTGNGEYLFPSHHRRRHPVMSENTINKILRNMGYGGRQVGHGFRAIASTVLNESAKFRPDAIEAQLSHIEENSSRKPYNRAEYIDERKVMMQWWSDYLAACEAKKIQKTKASKVIPMRATRVA
jgi:Integrase